MLLRGGSVRNYLEDNGLIFPAGMIQTSIAVGGFASFTQTWDISIEGLRLIGKLPEPEAAEPPKPDLPLMYMAVAPRLMPWADKEPHWQLGDYHVKPLYSNWSGNFMGYNIYLGDSPNALTIDGEEFGPCYFNLEPGPLFQQILWLQAKEEQ